MNVLLIVDEKLQTTIAKEIYYHNKDIPDRADIYSAFFDTKILPDRPALTIEYELQRKPISLILIDVSVSQREDCVNHINQIIKKHYLPEIPMTDTIVNKTIGISKVLEDIERFKAEYKEYKNTIDIEEERY